MRPVVHFSVWTGEAVGFLLNLGDVHAVHVTGCAKGLVG